MESTPAWLASTIEKDLEDLARGLEAWLGAAGVPGVRTRSRTVLIGLAGWLRKVDGPDVARRSLETEQARRLARSFVYEHLKSEGHLGPTVPARQREVDTLLDAFFAIGPAFVKGV